MTSIETDESDKGEGSLEVGHQVVGILHPDAQTEDAFPDGSRGMLPSQ